MESFIEFFSFTNPNVRYVTLGCILLSVSSAVVGSFTFLKKRALVGDAVAHSVLPGVCLAFILSGTKNPVYLIIGAFITAWISLLFIDLVTKRSKIKEDTAISITLSVFFGLGIMLLTMIQHSGNASQSGLDSFLFGKAAALIGTDLYVFGGVAFILLFVVGLFFKEFTLIAFDTHFAQVIGLPVKRIEFVLTTLTVLAVVVGIQAVGVVLMAAMLITPPAAARFWTDSLRKMLVIAACLGAFAGLSGAYISYIAPSMPTGPWIVMVISFIAVLSFLLAPQKGILFKWLKQRKIRQTILEENILKAFFLLGEREKNFYQTLGIERILEKRHFPLGALKKTLPILRFQGYLKKVGNEWQLTQAGFHKGQRVVKLHRLWELYLTEYLHIAPDHVHDDAETIEHIISPEIEKQLEKKLNYPTLDPHQSEIPYR
ncbi:iron chelate uptake ABC transporter family permease subunit [Cytophagales bacterium LB-30]|uniref:Iron chelate uptake ABC transporter family permease subunit n=1 Tax=Shiella aurantiaca TaxID=3058365 RepID=A0ABT8F108_9BACT|nr:iron chelate uptake ABC transporter family permease subunit [Shiella aurantiaca]MDN4164117.1 iron chelate uptake ABC transporter family permease subunit [Shiella aurantiaca]